MTRKKTLLTLFSAVLLCLALAIIDAGPASAAEPSDFKFDMATGAITGYTGSGGNVKIPSEIYGVPVRSIGRYAFQYHKEIVSVVIPNTVTSIGDYAFQSCTALKKVDIPYSVTEIGLYAFHSCTSLRQAIIPSSVTRMGSGVFYNCTSLVSLVYQAQVPEIPQFFCQFCSSLAYFKIPDNVTKIGYEAFYGCKNLQALDFPASVNVIDSHAYQNCTGLKTLNIPDTVSSVGSDAFRECTSLKNAVINSTRIGIYCFQRCSSLTDVLFGSNAVSIDSGALYGCQNLTNVTIPANVVSIANDAFKQSTQNLTIYCAQGSAAHQVAAANGVKVSFGQGPAFDNSPAKPLVEKDIDVTVNGEYLYFEDQDPVIEDSRTLVPVRAIFEALGATIQWDGKTSTATATRNGITIIIQINNNIMYKNGTPIALDVPAKIINDRTMVPARAVSEAFDCGVTWDAQYRTAVIVE